MDAYLSTKTGFSHRDDRNPVNYEELVQFDLDNFGVNISKDCY